MARAVGFFAQAIPEPATRAALNKVVRCHCAALLPHALQFHAGDAAERELRDRLVAFYRANIQRIGASGLDDPNLQSESLGATGNLCEPSAFFFYMSPLVIVSQQTAGLGAFRGGRPAE